MRSRLKVALYAGVYKKNQDGATKTLYELTNSLLQRNFKVKIMAFSITPQKKKELSLFKVWAIPLFFYPEYKIAFPFPHLKRHLNEYKPDIIHIAAPDLVGVFLLKYARKRNIPLVMSYHTDFPSYLKSYKINFLKKTLWKYFRWFYNKAETVFVPTRIVSQELANKGIKNTKIWSRGIYIDHFNPGYRSNEVRSKWGAADKKVILYSGRFVKFKDLQSFIGVYNLFKEKGPRKTVFVLLGNGPTEKKLKKSMPEAVFPGYLTDKDLSIAYASADIFFFPSTTETFGNVILESLSSGVPVVVSDIGGCQEIVNNSGGGLVAKAGDAGEFYDCCKKIVRAGNLAQKFKKNGLHYSRNQTWEKINDRVISEYYKIIEVNVNKGEIPK